MKNRIHFLLLVSTIFLFVAKTTFGQDIKEKHSERDQPSKYYLGTEEKLLLPVNILGLVQKPGQYMVPYRTDLISLIAFASGFRDGAKITNVKIVRSAGTNGNDHAEPKIFNVDVKKYFETGDQSIIPQLMPDDTVIVSGTTTQAINKFFDIFSRAVLIAQFYFYIRVAADR